MIRVVQMTHVAPQPWKNGGGITRDLLAWPPGADWLLRISVAEVAQSGPFSAYPGITRWFAVLRGEGVVLRFADRVHTLAPGSQPLRFDGADAPGCDLIQGPTLDLNLLANSSAGRADMRSVLPGVPWVGDAPLRAVFTTRAVQLHVAGQAPTAVPAFSLAYTLQGAGPAWQVNDDSAQAWWLEFTPRSA
jgi:environmental stress-induced protein Ves